MKRIKHLFIFAFMIILSLNGKESIEAKETGKLKISPYDTLSENFKDRNFDSSILFEDFEGDTFPPEGWGAIVSGVGFAQASEGYESSKSAYHDDVNGAQDSWLYTPMVDLEENSILTFMEKTKWGSYIQLHEVAVSTDLTNWTTIYSVSSNPSAVWTEVSLSLGDYAGSAYIGFHYIGQFSDEWYIDNVEIGDGTIAPDTEAPQFVSLYGNNGEVGSDMNLTLVVSDETGVPETIEATYNLTGNDETLVMNLNRANFTYTGTIISPAVSASSDITFHLLDTANPANSVDLVKTISFNTVPTIELPESFTFDEDSSLVVDLSPYVNDVDGDSLTLSASSNGNIMISFEGLVATLSAAPNYNGTEVISIVVNDNNLSGKEEASKSTAFDTVEIVVNPVNDSPTIELPDIFLLGKNESLVKDLASYINDADGDDLTISISGNSNIFAEIQGSVVTFTATENWTGTETITVTVDDGNSKLFTKRESSKASVSDTIDITVAPIILFEDFEGDVFPPEGWGSIVSGAGFVQAFEGYQSSKSVYHNDDQGAQDSWIYTPIVDLDENSILTFMEKTKYPTYTQLHEVAVSTDLINWTTIYSVSGNPATVWSEVALPLGDYAGSAHIGFHYIGNYSDEWYIDNVRISGEGSVQDTEAPQFVSLDGNNGEVGSDMNLTLVVSDQTGVPSTIEATYNLTGNDETLVMNLNRDLFTYTGTIPSPAVSASSDITFHLLDTANPVNSVDLVKTISFNTVPTIELPESFTFDEDSSLVVDLSPYINDADGDDLTLSVSDNFNTMVTFAGLVATFTAVPNYNGSEIITITVDDGNSKLYKKKDIGKKFTKKGVDRASSFDTVEIVVNSVNDVPTIELPNSFLFGKNESLVKDLSPYINDADGDDLTISISGNSNIFAEIQGSVVTFTATENWTGTETITVTVDDGNSKLLTKRESSKASVSDTIDITVASIVLFEEFENFPPEGWTVQGDNWNPSYGNYAGGTAPEAHFYWSPQNTGDQYLITKPLDTSGRSSVSISFNHMINHYGPGYECKLVTSTDMENWEVIHTFPGQNIGPELFSTEISNNHVGSETLYIAFMFSGNSYQINNWYIDNVVVTKDDSVQDTEAPQFVSLDGNTQVVGSDMNLTLVVSDETGVPSTIEATYDLIGSEETLVMNLSRENYTYTGTISSPEEASSGDITFHLMDTVDPANTVDIVKQISFNDPVNNSPTIELPENLTFDEDGSLEVDLSPYINDVDDDDLTLSVSDNSNIMVTFTGLVATFTAAPNYNGSETITITVDDGNSKLFTKKDISKKFTKKGVSRATAFDTIDIIVNPVNDAPTIELPESLTFDEDSSLEMDLSPYINDVDGDNLTLSVSDNSNIMVTFTGLVATFSATENYNGSEVITITVDDGNSKLFTKKDISRKFTKKGVSRATAFDTVEIIVNPVDDAPEIIEIANLPVSPIGSVVTLDLNSNELGFDGESDEDLTWSVEITNPNVDGDIEFTGTISETSIGSDIFTIDPQDINFSGKIEIKLTLSNGILTDTQENIIIDWDDNGAPVITLDQTEYSADEDNPIVLNLSDENMYDPEDDDSELYWEVTNFEIGNVVVNGNEITFTTPENFNGSGNATLKLFDTNGASSEIELSLTWNPVDDPVVLNLPEIFEFDEDQSLDLDFIALGYIVDPDSDQLTLTASNNSNIILEITGTNVSISSPANWNGSENITFTVTDGISIVSEVVAVNVNSVNDAPTINLPNSFTFNEDESLVVNFKEMGYVDDVDDVDLTLMVSGNSSVLVSIQQDLVTFSAPQNWNGSEILTFTVYDSGNSKASASDSVEVIVTPINDDPIINLPNSFAFDEDSSLEVDFSPYIEDVDLDDLTLTATGNTNINVTFSGLVAMFSAPLNWNGMETITISVNDNSGKSIASDNVEVVVTPINDAPTINLPDSFTFDEDASLEVDLSPYIEDVDSDEFTLSSTGNTNINVTFNGLVALFSAPQNWNGSESVTISVSDNMSKAVSSDVVEVIVTPINDDPIINLPNSFTFDEDASLEVDLSQYIEDVDLDDLTLTATGNTNINVIFSGLVAMFSAPLNWNGMETITISVNDNNGRSIVSDNVEVVVTPVNDLPVMELPETIAYNEDDILTVDFTQYIEDVDTEELVLSVSGTINTIVNIDGFIVTFGAVENWNGSETITFKLHEINSRGFVTDNVIVNVLPVNDAPTIVSFYPINTSLVITNSDPITFGVTAEDVDSDISYSWTLDGEPVNGDSTFVNEFTENGNYEVKVVVSDGELEASQTWNVEVAIVSIDENLPKVTKLNGNYPNPFNPKTTISFDLSESGLVSLKVYNRSGQLVKTLVNEFREAGKYSVDWVGMDIPSGVYFYRLSTKNYNKTMKAIIIK